MEPASEVREAPRNRSHGMWLAHVLTMSRVALAILFWVIAPHRAWAIVTLVAAGLTDNADGRVARRARRLGAVDDTGEWLDPLCDKLFAAIVLVGLAVRLDVPVWVLLLVAARELVLVPLLLVYWLTPLHVRWPYDFHSLPAGKLTTVAQFVSVVWLVTGVAGGTVVAAITAVLGLAAAARYLEQGWRVVHAH
ncbi:MAG: CDP-alcohol phosphatidyltransferase family protein [Deltaproteobacteria bacterium]|nr:CDP-alcohol phosphatidyltransferase family protein [Deltaproteobacteria bacterium]MCW5801228.1 CDP-alcohol phosphatidyltransferase family protein [Deltaproteobacteria bacterium]